MLRRESHHDSSPPISLANYRLHRSQHQHSRNSHTHIHLISLFFFISLFPMSCRTLEQVMMIGTFYYVVINCSYSTVGAVVYFDAWRGLYFLHCFIYLLCTALHCFIFLKRIFYFTFLLYYTFLSLKFCIGIGCFL